MKYRYINGYKLIYKPGHPNAMSSDNWDGWIYEHIYIASLDIGRKINEDEEIHHLDGDKTNNSPSNLIVLTKSGHAKLHSWLKSCNINLEDVRSSNGGFLKKDSLYCIVCSKVILKNKKFCSNECRNKIDKRGSRIDSYSLDYVLFLIDQCNGILGAAKRLSISDNGLRKWLKTRHGIVNRKMINDAIMSMS